MLETIIALIISLIKDAAVVMVVAYFISRSRLYAQARANQASWRSLGLLTLIFGLLSIWGTVSGGQVMNAIVNTRDLGPAIAGLFFGPWVGLGAAAIGAAHRLTLGGPTVAPCVIATLLAGLGGGLIHRLRRGRAVGFWGAFGFAGGIEVAHMLLLLALVRPFDYIIAFIGRAAAAMIIANALGAGLFALIARDQAEECPEPEQT